MRSAGRRDSALTNHGVDQARRLGAYLAANRPALTRVFASPLQRAHKTANVLTSAQSSSDLAITTVPELVEKDFGYYEGKPSTARSRDSSKAGKGIHRDAHKNDPDFVDVESKDSLAHRADTFLDEHLLHVLDDEAEFGGAAEHVVAIVSHGILLSHLWRRLLLRLQPKTVVVTHEVLASRGRLVLEHLGGWSNTGFLELSIQAVDSSAGSEVKLAANSITELTTANKDKADTLLPESSFHDSVDTLPAQGVNDDIETPLPASQSDPLGDVSLTKQIVDLETSEKKALRLLDGYRTTILMIDGKEHLTGLKRMRGGISRAEHDEKQRTMDSFFKRARKE